MSTRDVCLVRIILNVAKTYEWLTQLLVTMFMWGSARNLFPALSGHYHVIKDRTLWEVQECAASPDQWPACEGVKIPDESHNTMKLIWTFCKPQECKQKLQYCVINNNVLATSAALTNCTLVVADNNFKKGENVLFMSNCNLMFWKKCPYNRGTQLYYLSSQ